jgi:hypothetical protein
VAKDTRAASPFHDKLRSLGEGAEEVSHHDDEPTSLVAKEPSSPLEKPMSLRELATESLRLNEKPSSGFDVARVSQSYTG